MAPSAARGSSPRVRGKRDLGALLPAPARLIPARAGKTREAAALIAGPPAHPRACGENHSAWQLVEPRRGSSPRVRGKLGGDGHGVQGAGLIPARAGKTRLRRMAATPLAAHPRACGENSSPRAAPPRRSGSSPRVRGKRRVYRIPRLEFRLIPARAGKTSPSPPETSSSAAHPRACGENPISSTSSISWRGSSPRVRGKRGRS